MKGATHCRICASSTLVSLLDLGRLYLTGVFPGPDDPEPSEGPLELVKCQGPDACGLVQLRHSFDPGELYGDNYGYRSSLNRSMVEHLQAVVTRLRNRVSLGKGDVVLDIGSNDGTLLSFYPDDGPELIGIDPTSRKYARFYKPHIRRVESLFPSDALTSVLAGRRAKVVTSIAMAYDVEEPQSFFNDVAAVLADDGIWLLEQSYMPTMVEITAYDTICHEHLEYYGLTQIDYLARRAGLRVLDVALNDINGGSFVATVCKADAPHVGDPEAVSACLERERVFERDLAPFEAFREQVQVRRDELVTLLQRLAGEGKRVLGYGASTKGNVLLQYCGIGPDLLPCIAEVNEDKFGRTTPGTRIPIVSEAEARASSPDYFLVLPWHFRENLIEREAQFLDAGGKLIFPLPQLEIVSR
jgi:NDP-4-keto-2,6-dideoxyhexose 3-C-methyltransferase